MLIWRIKTSRPYHLLKRIPTLHASYMLLKSIFRRKQASVISLPEEELLETVIRYKELKSQRGRAQTVVYTAIINGYDSLKIPHHLNPDWDYICFSDRADFSGQYPWEIRPIPYIDGDPVRTARFVKVRPDILIPEYENSIWLDASIVPRDDFLCAAFDTFLTSDQVISSVPHPFRTCVYQEIEACRKLGKDDKKSLNEIEQYLKQERFPSHLGLLETGVLFRKHNAPTIQAFHTEWWRLINKYSRRDQLSILPALKVHDLEWGEILPKGKSVANHESFYLFSHRASLNQVHPQYPTLSFLPVTSSTTSDKFWWHTSPSVQPPSIHVQSTHATDVVICVHNAHEHVRKCLDSVLSYQHEQDKLIIIDDGSDSDMQLLLKSYQERTSSMLILRNENSEGYTRAANRGLQASTSDFVILLNSDTIVSRDWSLKIRQVADQHRLIGIVGPLSNAASFQSVPAVRSPQTGQFVVNEVPIGMTIEKMNQVCERAGMLRTFPLVPLVNGFCMGIKRELLLHTGFFDEATFPVGYGEEDDLCQRAIDAGYMLALATHCYVYHAKSQSFGTHTRSTLAHAGEQALRNKHGALRIKRALKTMSEHPVLKLVRSRVAEELTAHLAESNALAFNESSQGQ